MHPVFYDWLYTGRNLQAQKDILIPYEVIFYPITVVWGRGGNRCGASAMWYDRVDLVYVLDSSICARHLCGRDTREE